MTLIHTSVWKPLRTRFALTCKQSQRYSERESLPLHCKKFVTQHNWSRQNFMIWEPFENPSFVPVRVPWLQGRTLQPGGYVRSIFYISPSLGDRANFSNANIIFIMYVLFKLSVKFFLSIQLSSAFKFSAKLLSVLKELEICAGNEKMLMKNKSIMKISKKKY